MKTIVYSRWDGSQQPFGQKRKAIIDRFMENLMKGMSPNMSLSQMLWQGFPLAGMDFRVMGLEEMLLELENQKNDLFAEYSLEKIFDEPMDDLRNLIQTEAFERNLKNAPALPSSSALTTGLLEQLKQLERIDFIDHESRRLFQKWNDRRQDIIDLYEFYSQYSENFTGSDYLNFDQALDLMRQFKSLEKLQQQLMTGQFSEIDPEQIRKWMGEAAQQSFNILIQLPRALSEQGVAKFSRKGVEITPRGMRALGESAFGKIIHHLKKDRQGDTSGNAPQTGEILPDSSRPYQFGDRFDLDIARTVLNGVTRGGICNNSARLTPNDFHVREREQLVTTTTVVLLDLSWSMSRNGRFEAAKKVALALDHYIRTRFPKDKIHIAGFSTEASELRGKALALAEWDAQQPFTNLQGGLQLAMQLIKRSGNRNNRVIVITDGQPTAYYTNGQLHVEFPDSVHGFSHNACKATLGEVRRVTAQGMNIDIFMLDDNPVLIEYTHQIARINKGRAVLCVPGKLGELIFIEEIKRRGGRF